MTGSADLLRVRRTPLPYAPRPTPWPAMTSPASNPARSRASATTPRRWPSPASGCSRRARGVYRSYGFVPIDTPALEYTEVLLGKGGEETDKQLFRFTDNGGRDVALRFDLTVPFARFAAQHLGPARHAVQALPPGPGVAGREHPAGPLPRVPAVRLRHDRHHLQRGRHRGGPGHRRPAGGPRLRAVHRPRQQPAWCSTACWRELGLAEAVGALLRALDKLAKVGAEAVAAEMVERAGVDAGPGRAGCWPWRGWRARTAPCSTGSTRTSGANATAAEGIAPAAPSWSTWSRPAATRPSASRST